ncbi:MAG: IPT/TIG domain-containing protein, partial [Acidobacteriota bacterium]|nr:IPT/TIG domain-containing protein [Acidobacteriota bacterium]
ALSYVTLDVAFNLGATSGPQHLVFNTPDYMYVAPAGITLTESLPPTVAAAVQNGDGTVTVTGANWTPASLIYFDGLPAAISSLDAKKGEALVTPPPGPPGQTSIVTVFNSDGQNSQFLQLSSPVTYTYGGADVPSISAISPHALPAGAEAAVDIAGTGFNFIDGRVNVGFGTSDIVVRRIFVLSPSHIQVDVSVSPNAALSNPDVSVMSGFQLATATAGFEVDPAVTGLPAAVPILPNAIPGLTGSYAGALVSLYGVNLAAPNATPAITIGGQPAPVIYASAGQINLQIPSGLQPGPAILTLNNGVAAAYPVTVNIDTVPAAIVSVESASGNANTPSAPAHQGDVVIIGLTNFSPGASSVIQAGVNGSLHNVIPVGVGPDGSYQISVVLGPNEPVGSSLPLIVYLDGRSSYPASISIATPGGAFALPAN